MKLSVVIPAYNEEGCLEDTVRELYAVLKKENLNHEILVINDNSKDNTLAILELMEKDIPTLRHLTNTGPNGYGYAVRMGLNNFTGDCIAVYMADMSDDPNDLIAFYRKMLETDCDMVLGSRWIKKGLVHGYPKHKLLLNRIVNHIIRCIFFFRYNDITNGFKLFSRETILGLEPYLSGHFSLALELPLKAIVRGFSYTVLPNSWTNREIGVSNLKIRQMSSRYMFVVLYCLIEKCFSMGDYKKGKINATRS